MGISSGTGAVGFMPVGVVVPFAGSTSPAGWQLCYGQAISRTTYAGLFAVIGTTYGAGDGSTTFALPDLRGRSVAGVDDMGGTAANRITNAVSGIVGTTLGAVGGNQIMPLHSHANTATFTGTAGNTGNQSQDHTHGTGNANSWLLSNRTGGTVGTGGSSAQLSAYLDQTGGMSVSHTHAFTPAGSVTMTNANAGTGSSANVQPTIVLNYIIKAA